MSAAGRASAGAPRNGYTTGTCAAAAARAAALFFLTGERPERVTVTLPEGQGVSFAVSGGDGDFPDFFRVKKDAGDDPDVTDGSFVYARVQPLSGAEWEEKRAGGKGYLTEEYPGLYLDGGPGIGTVTLPGLSCPVGHYAINPVPRRMILSEVDAVRRKEGFSGRLLVQIAIPEGIRLAQKTFNPRLGVLGGISVLGTTGIVRPMSEEAMLETIRLDIRQKHLTHPELLLMTPGNYGENFLAQSLGIPFGQAVVCSNFVGAAMEMLKEEGAGRLLFVGHIGKLVKAAAGMPNTHSRYGDHRMETLAGLLDICREEETKAGDVGACLREKILAANTTDEALGYLLPVPAAHGGGSMAEEVLCKAACAAAKNLAAWGADAFTAEVITFSSALGLMGETPGAGALAKEAAAWGADCKERRPS